MNSVTIYANKKIPTSYASLLEKLQGPYVEDMWQINQDNITEDELREKTLAFFMKKIDDNNVSYDGFTKEAIAQRLYNDIEKFSILTPYLVDDDVEGININAWNNIRVKYHSGKEVRAEPFLSPKHAITIIKRLLDQSGMTIDESYPVAEGSLDNNIRIEAIMCPIVDRDVGVVAYIRKLRNKVFTSEEYYKYGFASKKMLDLLHVLCKRGLSILIVGKVNTGKTTLLKHILDSMPNEMQINTIESGAREFNIIKYDNDGNPINNVVHLQTRHNKDTEMDITQEKLVVAALRLNGDIVPVAEMRDTEAGAAIEAANAGNVVVSTAHAGSAQYAHIRIANLSRKKYPTDFHTAHIDACQAFPICVFIHTGDDGIRRIMNISECYVENDTPVYQTIWEFQVEDNIEKGDGSVEVIGEFVQTNNPSTHMIEHMKMYGVTKKELGSLLIKGSDKQ